MRYKIFSIIGILKRYYSKRNSVLRNMDQYYNYAGSHYSRRWNNQSSYGYNFPRHSKATNPKAVIFLRLFTRRGYMLCLLILVFLLSFVSSITFFLSIDQSKEWMHRSFATYTGVGGMRKLKTREDLQVDIFNKVDIFDALDLFAINPEDSGGNLDKRSNGASHKHIDIDSAGHQSINSASLKHIYGAGHKHIDGAGHKHIVGAGHKHIDGAVHKNIEGAVHKNIEGAGHEHKEGAGQKHIVGAVHKNIDKLASERDNAVTERTYVVKTNQSVYDKVNIDKMEGGVKLASHTVDSVVKTSDWEVCPEIEIPYLVGELKSVDLSDIPLTTVEQAVFQTSLEKVKKLTASTNQQLSEISRTIMSTSKDSPSLCFKEKGKKICRNAYPKSIVSKTVNVAHLNYAYMSGGHWKPTDCTPRWKVAIIIPFRDRSYHLPIILQHLTPFLQRQRLEFGFFVIEQANNLKFNRAMLMNVGFLEALNFTKWDCFIFHDVDHIPINDNNYYGCSGMPKHFMSAADRWNYKIPYSAFFGAVTGFTRGQVFSFNGFPNVYWGWGGEDDEIFERTTKVAQLTVSRVDKSIGRYNVIQHHHRSAPKEKDRFSLLANFKSRSGYDGLINLKYDDPTVTVTPLYTNISVNIKKLYIPGYTPEKEAPKQQTTKQTNKAQSSSKVKSGSNMMKIGRNDKVTYQKTDDQVLISTNGNSNSKMKQESNIMKITKNGKVISYKISEKKMPNSPADNTNNIKGLKEKGLPSGLMNDWKMETKTVSKKNITPVSYTNIRRNSGRSDTKPEAIDPNIQKKQTKAQKQMQAIMENRQQLRPKF